MKRTSPIASLRTIAAAVAVLALGGCATFSRDGGLDAASALTAERTGQDVRLPNSTAGAEAAQAELDQMLKQPISADGAVQVALLNNRGLQASLRRARHRRGGPGAGRAAGQSRLRLRRMCAAATKSRSSAASCSTCSACSRCRCARDIEQRRVRAAPSSAAAAERRARGRDAPRLVSSGGRAGDGELRRAGAEAAEASAELARRMARAGNFSKLEQLREQAFYAEAAAQLARARQQRDCRARAAHPADGRLGRGHRVPASRPAAGPARPHRAMRQTRSRSRCSNASTFAWRETDAESTAVARPDQSDRLHQRARRSASTTRASPASRARTATRSSCRLPLFDWGGARVARAEATYMQAVHRAADTADRSPAREVREAYSAYRTAYDLARHYRDEIVPLRKRISEENLLRYNGMLIERVRAAGRCPRPDCGRERRHRRAARLLARRDAILRRPLDAAASAAATNH